jgi:hypothetical protein
MDERCVAVVTALITSLFCENFRALVIYEWLRFSSKVEEGCIASFAHVIESILKSKISLSIRHDHIEIFSDNPTLRIPKTTLQSQHHRLLNLIETCWPRFFETRKQSFDPGADALEGCLYDSVVSKNINREILVTEVLMRTLGESIRLWDGKAFPDVYEIVYGAMKNLLEKNWVHPMTEESRNHCIFLLKTIEIFKEGSSLLHEKIRQDNTMRIEAPVNQGEEKGMVQ